MKIQKQKTRGDYFKYVIVLPKDKIEASGFKEGEELEAEAKKGELKLRKKKWAEKQ